MKVFLIAYITKTNYGAYLAFAESLNAALKTFRESTPYMSYEITEVTPNILKHFVHKGESNE